jgi:hypothetical protein
MPAYAAASASQRPDREGKVRRRVTFPAQRDRESVTKLFFQACNRVVEQNRFPILMHD